MATFELQLIHFATVIDLRRRETFFHLLQPCRMCLAETALQCFTEPVPLQSQCEHLAVQQSLATKSRMCRIEKGFLQLVHVLFTELGCSNVAIKYTSIQVG
ncbi:hypothetical protein D3C77_245350 [compost metagenome]